MLLIQRQLLFQTNLICKYVKEFIYLLAKQKRLKSNQKTFMRKKKKVKLPLIKIFEIKKSASSFSVLNLEPNVKYSKKKKKSCEQIFKFYTRLQVQYRKGNFYQFKFKFFSFFKWIFQSCFVYMNVFIQFVSF